MKHTKSIFSAVVVLSIGAGLFLSQYSCCEIILNKSEDLPITSFNVTFRAGSADDPTGAEGLAHVTARMLREGGVRAWGSYPARTRAELEEFLFPLAADIAVSTEKEQTSFDVTSSAADAEIIFGVLSQIILAPEFSPVEFERIKSETLDSLGKQWPREDQEELGKAALDQVIYGEHHRYFHVVEGKISAVANITLDKVKAFYLGHYVQKRITMGIAGVIPNTLASAAKGVVQALPEGDSSQAQVPVAIKPEGLNLLIVKGPFEATGVHLGIPLSFNRSGIDFPGMYLASTAFGKHRSFVGRLMRVVREIRGLNYGTYSYVEDFPNGGQSLIEPSQASRSRQAFTVWGRPTTLENGCFLLRQLLRELTKLNGEGLTTEEYELGRSHLLGYIPQLATGIERRLGYDIDSFFYGISGDYLGKLRSHIENTTYSDMNLLIKKHLDPTNMHIVVVTPDPVKYQDEILSARCSIHYPPGVVKPDDVLKEDEEIASFPVRLDAAKIRVKDAETLFR